MISASDNENLVSRLPFSSLLGEEEKREVQRKARYANLSEGTILRDRKTSVDSLVYVKSGLLRVYSENSDRRQILLFYIPQDSFCSFTAPSLIHASALDYKVEAAWDSETIMLDDELVMGYEEKYPQIRTMIDNALSERLSSLFKVLSSIVSEDLRTRILKYLLYMSEILKSDDVAVTHRMISQDLNCRREVVTRILSSLAKEGKVSLSRGSIRIHEKTPLGT